jgi:MFS transporter, PAT family, beta-lactamase induction signal transducer AmpG
LRSQKDSADRQRLAFWVFTTYFAEGFPYSLVRQISTVFFKDFGASLQAIGLTSLYGLPWVLKFLWAPLADAFLTKRRWLLIAEFALVLSAVALALGATMPGALTLGSVLFLVTAFFSASHDIAIDGYYLEALDKRRQAQYVGFQAMSYRIALITGGGGVVWLSGVTSWSTGFWAAAVLLAALFLYHCFFLPKVETQQRDLRSLAVELAKPWRIFSIIGAVATVAVVVLMGRTETVQQALAPWSPYLKKIGIPGFITLGLLLVLVSFVVALPALKRRLFTSDSFYAQAFVDYLDQPRIGVILAFLVLYRTGESFLLSMVYPMLKDIGITRDIYGLIYGTFGITASITGGILGGYLIGRFGLKRVIWPLVLAQNIPNLLYMVLAFSYRGIAGRADLGAANPMVVAVFVVLEAFGAGLGTSVFMVFIMRTCKPAYKAAHMAIATSIMNVSSTFAGVFSGYLAAWFGFSAFFGFTFLATVPGMALIAFLPHLEDPR